MNVFLRTFQIVLAISGFISLGIGIGADVLFAGNPGFSVGQILLTILGILLLAFAWSLQSPKLRNALVRAFTQDIGKKLLLISVSVLFTLVVVEIGLAVLGFQPHSLGSPEADAIFLQPAAWWYCDELGCRIDREVVQADCEAGKIEYTHYCDVNAQGFYSPHAFVSSDTLEQADYRILLLGDSYTWGLVSTKGNSWAEILDISLQADEEDVVIWNTGIIGTGTEQASLLLEEYAPIMNPDLVILGFYPNNDFFDNVLPLDKYVYALQGDSVMVQYDIASDLTISRRSEGELAYLARSLHPPTNHLEYPIRSTRIGSFLSEGIHSLTQALGLATGTVSTTPVTETEVFWERGVVLTRQYLAQIRDYTQEQGITFLVLIIPDRDNDFDEALTINYQTTLELLDELGIAYIESLPILEPDSDYEPGVGKHWNNSGHGKVGVLITTCVREILAGANPGDCHELTQ